MTIKELFLLAEKGGFTNYPLCVYDNCGKYTFIEEVTVDRDREEVELW